MTLVRQNTLSGHGIGFPPSKACYPSSTTSFGSFFCTWCSGEAWLSNDRNVSQEYSLGAGTADHHRNLSRSPSRSFFHKVPLFKVKNTMEVV